MIKKTFFYTTFIFINLFCLNAQQILRPYDFLIKPGTPEWSNLKTENERFDAMQIPKDTLSSMSTPDLVATCLNFPAFGYITAFENIQTGFIILATKFNGLKELAKRQDAAKYLVSIYKETGKKGFNNPNLNLNEEYWTIKFTWIELLLAQNPMILSLGEEDKKKLLLICQDKYNLKRSNEEYSLVSLTSTIFLMSRILYTVNDDQFELEYSQNEALRTFVETSELTEQQIINIVLKLTNNYLKNKL